MTPRYFNEAYIESWNVAEYHKNNEWYRRHCSCKICSVDSNDFIRVTTLWIYHTDIKSNLSRKDPNLTNCCSWKPSRSHFKDDTQTMLQYVRNLFNTLYEGLKRQIVWSAYYITHWLSYYPIPENEMTLVNLLRFSKQKCRIMLSSIQRADMRDWGNDFGKCMKQKSVRQETPKFKTHFLSSIFIQQMTSYKRPLFHFNTEIF